MSGRDLARLVAEYGSPLYVYDLGEVRRAHRGLSAALPVGATVLYSLKANPHPRLVAELGRQGCGAEVSSLAELRIALDAGMKPDETVYTGPGRSAGEAEAAIRLGARLFSVDSAPQLELVRAAAVRLCVDVSVLLRINPVHRVRGAGLAMTGVASPFGVDSDQVLAAPARFASAERCEVVGLHFYLGSNVSSAAALARQFDESLSLAAEICAALDLRPRLLDLGGGFPRSYLEPDDPPVLDGLADAIAASAAANFPPPEAGGPRLFFESGRHLVGSCGVLVATVLDVKESKGGTFAVLDSGINHLGGMSGLGRLPRVRPVVVPVATDGPAPESRRMSIVGPLCTPLDFWCRSIDAALGPGDHVVVPNVGAYGLTASLVAFLGRDCPTEVVVDDDGVVDVSALVYERRPGRPNPSPEVEYTP